MAAAGWQASGPAFLSSLSIPPCEMALYLHRQGEALPGLRSEGLCPCSFPHLECCYFLGLSKSHLDGKHCPPPKPQTLTEISNWDSINDRELTPS